MKQKEFKAISKRSKELLQSGENLHVDYKEKLKGLHAEDFVAFANSTHGGAILIGVKENTNELGQQIGTPNGCEISDDAKLQIISKALSCIPPIQVEVFTENTQKKAFYRIEIPTGEHKPYCTNSGTYKIREDARNSPIHPKQLLTMFLEKEGKEFRDRFADATGNLEQQMIDTLQLVGELENAINSKIDEISSSMGWAEYEASSAKNTIDTVDSYTKAIHRNSEKLNTRIEAVLSQLNLKDPIKENTKKEILNLMVKEFEENETLLESTKKGEKLSFEIRGNDIEDLEKYEIQEIVKEAIKIAEENISKKLT